MAYFITLLCDLFLHSTMRKLTVQAHADVMLPASRQDGSPDSADPKRPRSLPDAADQKCTITKSSHPAKASYWRALNDSRSRVGVGTKHQARAIYGCYASSPAVIFVDHAVSYKPTTPHEICRVTAGSARSVRTSM